MMGFMLEHQYCQAGLSFQLFKNVDRVVADVLSQATAQVDFYFYLGNVLLQEV